MSTGGFPGKLESRNLSRGNLDREIGRTRPRAVLFYFSYFFKPLFLVVLFICCLLVFILFTCCILMVYISCLNSFFVLISLVDEALTQMIYIYIYIYIHIHMRTPSEALTQTQVASRRLLPLKP